MTATSASVLTRTRRFLRRHWLILIVLALAAALRAIVWLAVHPAWWIIGDSIGYLNDLLTHSPDRWRPSGYSILVLGTLQPFHRLTLVTSVQHLMGLGVGVLIYATVLRLGLPPWAGALAAMPALFDGYVLMSEQTLASEPLFTLLLVGALVLLMWRAPRPPLVYAGAAGLLLGLASVTRIIGIPLIAVAAVVIILPRPAWSRLVALGVAFVLPVGVYAVWFDRHYHEFNLTASSGMFLYGRTTNFVDCARVRFSDPRLRSLCPVGSHYELWYVFDVDSPISRTGLSEVAANSLAGTFALEAIRTQPDGYAALTWKGLMQTFEWDQSALYNDLVVTMDVPLPDGARAAAIAYQGGDPGPRYQPSLVKALTAYQRVASVPGTLCLVALLVSLIGLVFGRDPEGRGLRGALVLTAGTSAALLVVTAATTFVAARYRIPAIPPLCLAVAISGSLLVNRVKARCEAPVVADAEGPMRGRSRA